MGKLQEFYIEFESRDDVYHAGETVTGFAFIELSESIDVRGEGCSVTDVTRNCFFFGGGAGAHSGVYWEYTKVYAV